MPHGTEHHLEEAEHAPHHTHDPFQLKVAVTIAILAAALACVTMLSHRSHSETLQHEIRSNDDITEAANQWAYYQAKKNRQYMLEANCQMLQVLQEQPSESAKKQIADWRAKASEYKEDTKKIEDKARDLGKDARVEQGKAEEAHHSSNRFDFGELGVEMALVLCSIALLTRRREFWYVGLILGAIGFVWAMTAFLPHASHENHPGEGETHHAWSLPRDDR
jgi:hypothetical protein